MCGWGGFYPERLLRHGCDEKAAGQRGLLRRCLSMFAMATSPLSRDTSLARRLAAGRSTRGPGMPVW